jgi:hypothetical protein
MTDQHLPMTHISLNRRRYLKQRARRTTRIDQPMRLQEHELKSMNLRFHRNRDYTFPHRAATYFSLWTASSFLVPLSMRA